MKFLKVWTGILSIALFFAFATSAMALKFDPEYELFTFDTYGMPTNYSSDAGLYIWSNDFERRDWSMRWTSPGVSSDPFYWNINVLLSSNTFGDVNTYMFESSGAYSDEYLVEMGNQFLSIDSYTNNSGGIDGIDFSILGDVTPSFIAFDIFTEYGSDVASMVFIGEGFNNPESQDFKAAAPVPEPATLLLLGSGLVGLAFLKRRKS